MTSPGVLLAIAAGGALGSVFRYQVGGWATRQVDAWLPGHGFPVGTLAVNVVGSFCIGIAFAWLEQGNRDPVLREALMGFLVVGMLGGFTTFSAFSLETVHLIGSGFWGRVMLNIIVSVVVCIGAAFAGLSLARSLMTA